MEGHGVMACIRSPEGLVLFRSLLYLKRGLGIPSSILFIIAAMLSKHAASPDAAISQHPSKKQRTLVGEADRAQKYVHPNQPGRVLTKRIGFHELNRGGVGVHPLHTHRVALDICTEGTSSQGMVLFTLSKFPKM